MTDEDIVGELLTRLERREAQLLDWGFFDVAHTADEVIALFAADPRHGDAFRRLAGNGTEALFVDDLASSQLLYRIPDTLPTTYRSRFAESARLFVRLRQRFQEEDWTYAPELVSEARFHLAPRRIPVREILPSSMWAQIADDIWLPSVQGEVFSALTGKKDGGFQLAGFQLRATRRLLQHYRGTESSAGTVVTAGTGGGKTKSFYIPAFMGIAADISANPAPSTKVLAVYPRNVLLADQFAEATGQAMLVNEQLTARLKRPICVAALLGDVPFTADFERDSRNKWSLSSWKFLPGPSGYLVPHIRDPRSRGPLVWLNTDRLAGRTTLRRVEDPSQIAVPDGVVLLTRDAILATPPDIFLTSIEMINKELSGEIGRRVLGFGTGGSAALRLVLLDEIHTYEGLTGAQIPWILRRLSYWTRGGRRGQGNVHYVGLSATLQDACQHLATLTGAPEEAIQEICPEESLGEISIEGNEYNVVLKSHPGSGAGVLATSIQSVMLGARVLTPRAPTRSAARRFDPAYFFGRKVFGFTDNLDVVNRFFPDFVNADSTRRLARLRISTPDDYLKWQAGQTWRLCEGLGYNLASPLTVGRTSSQDPGVNNRADVVLATSALEVGFDDNEVGMVLQHKAPRSAASFLQRKGRAGRRRGMRPWTIVVLSEHGRDRWAFRDSERLFSPRLDRLSLPVFNPYVLRIQATWFLVDWIANKVGRGVPNLYLSRAQYSEPLAKAAIERLIGDPAHRDQLTRDVANWLRHGQGGVRLADPDALARDILWNPPRAVLRNVVPVLWREVVQGLFEGAGPQKARVLPKFLPERTWDVLDAQDVEFLIAGAATSHSMDARRALWEAVPGRVSRRHAVRVQEASKWLACSAELLLDPAPSTLSADKIVAKFLTLDDWPDLVIFQPTQLALADVPLQVKKSSNAEWDWEIRASAVGDGIELGVHQAGLLSALFDRSVARLHRDRSGLRVYRYATSVRYEIQLTRGVPKRGLASVAPPAGSTDARVPAVGFARAVDAIELQIRRELLDELPALSPDDLARWRPIYLRHCAVRSAVLRQMASPFGINLLCISALGMLAATALRQHMALDVAWERIPNKAAAARKVLQSILMSEVTIGGDDDPDDDGRNVQELMDLWSRPDVVAEMDRLISTQWAPPDSSFTAWLRDSFIDTVRAAVESAVKVILPEVPDSDLLVEVLNGEQGTTILIMESDAGGVGVIDRFLSEVGANPSLFPTALEASLTECRNERLLDNVLKAVDGACVSGSSLATAFQSVRVAGSYHELQSAKEHLVSELDGAACDADRESVTALIAKALLPGSGPVTDRWLRGLSAARQRAGARLGLALDPKLWAYWAMTWKRPRSQMAATVRNITGRTPTEGQLTQAVVRLTIDPCRDSCPECLGSASDFTGMMASRQLAQRWLRLERLERTIVVRETPDWLDELDEALSQGSRICIRHTTAAKPHVASELALRLANEYDRGYSLAGFRITTTRRRGEDWEIRIAVDDVEPD